MLGKRILYTDSDVEWLVGKKVFVSHAIRVLTTSGRMRFSFRMHRLNDEPSKDADIIRKAMCDAKITMLERIIAYPESPYHLSSTPRLFDYESRIRQAIEQIRHFPEKAIPQD